MTHGAELSLFIYLALLPDGSLLKQGVLVYLPLSLFFNWLPFINKRFEFNSVFFYTPNQGKVSLQSEREVFSRTD